MTARLVKINKAIRFMWTLPPLQQPKSGKHSPYWVELYGRTLTLQGSPTGLGAIVMGPEIIVLR
jgi:hypothetical protein